MYTYTDGIQRQTHEPADRHTEVNMETFDLKAIFVQNPHEVSLLPRAQMTALPGLGVPWKSCFHYFGADSEPPTSTGSI